MEHDANGKITRVDGICYQMVIWLAAKYNFTYYINLLNNFRFYFVVSKYEILAIEFKFNFL